MKNSLFFGGAAYNSKADNSGARTVYYYIHSMVYILVRIETQTR